MLKSGGKFVFGSGQSVTCHHQSSAGGQKITALNKHLITTNADTAGRNSAMTVSVCEEGPFASFEVNKMDICAVYVLIWCPIVRRLATN